MGHPEKLERLSFNSTTHYPESIPMAKPHTNSTNKVLKKSIYMEILLEIQLLSMKGRLQTRETLETHKYFLNCHKHIERYYSEQLNDKYPVLSLKIGYKHSAVQNAGNSAVSGNMWGPSMSTEKTNGPEWGLFKQTETYSGQSFTSELDLFTMA